MSIMEYIYSSTTTIPDIYHFGINHAYYNANMEPTQLNFRKQEWDLVYRVALRIVKAPDQAEDIAQDALLQAYSARERFNGKSKPESWLYRIAHNTAISYLRLAYNRRRSSADVGDVIDKQPHTTESPAQKTSTKQLVTNLDNCLRTMQPQDRLAFTERFVLGTPEKELGRILGVTPNAAKQRAFRARKTVRQHMEKIAA